MPAADANTAFRAPRVALAACLVSGAALAQGTPPPPGPGSGRTRLELNRLEPQGERCRVTLMVDNGAGETLRSLRLDLFAFDPAGVAQSRVSVELAPLPERKTTVRLFDLPLPCGRIGRVLLNEVLACEGPAGPREGCLEALETGARGSVPFVK